jgi:tetraacyldisaccharide 4'-kinase
MSGDEPYMLATNLPDVIVLVDKDRVKSGRYAINKYNCDTLILDDGFQYLHLKHSLDIVLVDKKNPFGNHYMLPRGILREPVANIARASVIFITKSDGKDDGLRDQLRVLNPHAEIVECCHEPRYLQNLFKTERRPLQDLQGARIGVVSGIAVPAGFEAELEKHGAELVFKHRYADHHRYSQQEIIDIVNQAVSTKVDYIVTTEKDAVRFPRLRRTDVAIYFLRVDIEILSGEENFRETVRRICFK